MFLVFAHPGYAYAQRTPGVLPHQLRLMAVVTIVRGRSALRAQSGVQM